MVNDEKVLSQAMIDALVSQVPVKPRMVTVETKIAASKAPESSKPVTTPTPSSKSPPTPVPLQTDTKAVAAQSHTSNEEVDLLKKRVDDLTRQVVKTLGLMQRLDIVEETMERQKALFTLQKKHTWNPRETFQCDDCNSSNLVAVYVKCTACGRETWMGWWPKE
jgi:hypothetical protein